MVFICSFCRLIDGRNPRRDGPGKCKLTTDNFVGAQVLLRKLHPQYADAVEQLELSKDATLCFECMPERERSKLTIVKNKQRVQGEILVGQPAIEWGGDEVKEGVVVDIAPGGPA